MARIYKRGNKYYLDYFVGGRRIRKSVSTNRRLAEDLLRDREIRRVRGDMMGQPAQPDLTFREFVDLYVRDYSPRKTESTRARDENTLKHLLPVFGKTLLRLIGQEDIEQYRASRLKLVRKSTVNREMGLLKGILHQAVEWGYLHASPAVRVRDFKVEEVTPKFMTAEQVEAVLSVVDEYIESRDPRGRPGLAPQFKTFFLLGVSTGMRKGEMLSLKWENVDLKRRVIVVPPGKNKRERTIPINDVLHEALRSHPRRPTSPFVFSEGRGKRLTDIRTVYQGILRKAGVPPMPIHAMRHTLTSNLFMSGADPRAIQEILGHRDPRTTMRYAHLTPGHLQRTVELLPWAKKSTLPGPEPEL